MADRSLLSLNILVNGFKGFSRCFPLERLHQVVSLLPQLPATRSSFPPSVLVCLAFGPVHLLRHRNPTPARSYPHHPAPSRTSSVELPIQILSLVSSAAFSVFYWAYEQAYSDFGANAGLPRCWWNGRAHHTAVPPHSSPHLPAPPNAPQLP